MVQQMAKKHACKKVLYGKNKRGERRGWMINWSTHKTYLTFPLQL